MPLFTVLLRKSVPVPVLVRFSPAAPAMVPVCNTPVPFTARVRVPAAPPRVSTPPLRLMLFVPVTVRSPFRLSAFAVVVTMAPAVAFSVPPVTVSAPAVVFPSAALLFRFSVPAASVVPPVKVFTPERVSVPAPCFVRLDAPLMTPVAARVPPAACWSRSGESRKMFPLRVFVPAVFCESTISAPEVLPVTLLIFPAKVCPPAASVSWKVAPSARFWVPVVPKSPPSRSPVVAMLPPLLSFSTPLFIR